MHVIVAEMGIRAGLASRHRGQDNKTAACWQFNGGLVIASNPATSQNQLLPARNAQCHRLLSLHGCQNY
jgi:hypothetical protein